MEITEILSHVDHTLLKPEATLEQILTICDEGVEYGTAAVCIPCSYIKAAANHVRGGVAVGAAIGFPNGYNTTAVKVFETKQAIADGADEIDMVINIGWLKDKKYAAILDEIKQVRAACKGKIFKVIIEISKLTDDEIIKMCGIVGESGADYIKTSTGFAEHGATKEAVALMRKHSPAHVKVKAAGGIKTLDDAEEYIKLGADRLGTSSIVALVKNK